MNTDILYSHVKSQNYVNISLHYYVHTRGVFTGFLINVFFVSLGFVPDELDGPALMGTTHQKSTGRGFQRELPTEILGPWGKTCRNRVVPCVILLQMFFPWSQFSVRCFHAFREAPWIGRSPDLVFPIGGCCRTIPKLQLAGFEFLQNRF